MPMKCCYPRVNERSGNDRSKPDLFRLNSTDVLVRPRVISDEEPIVGAVVAACLRSPDLGRTGPRQFNAALEVVPKEAIRLVEGLASAVAIHWSANPRHLYSSGRMQLHFARYGRTWSIRTNDARSLPVPLPPQRLPFASYTWGSVDGRPAKALDQISSTWASNAGFRKGGRPGRPFCLMDFMTVATKWEQYEVPGGSETFHF